MKHTGTIVITVLALLQFCCSSVLARPMKAHQAKKTVAGWMKANPKPLGTDLREKVRNVETFANDDGEPIYYIVYLHLIK